jgi:DNA-binding CsgD family transcriptional regulator
LREELGDPAALGRALATASLQQWTDLQVAAASASADRAVRLLEPAGDSAALASALYYYGVLLINIDREAEGRDRVEAAMAMGERVGSPAWRASGLVYRGRARMQCGDDGGRDDLLAGIAHARAGGDHETVMIGYMNLVGVLWRRGRYAELERHLADGDVYGRERDFPTHDRARDAYRYRLLALRGDWDAAERGLRELVDDPEGVGVVTRHALPGLARLAVRRGRPDAEHLVAAARENGDRADSLQAVVPAVVADMEHAWLTDRAEPARTAGRALLQRTARPGREREHAEVSRWLHRLGDVVEPVPDGPEEFAAGLRGDWRAAAAAWERVGDPYERALELAGSGEREPMLEALRVFDELGAEPVTRRLRRQLRASGSGSVPRGPQSTTRSNPAGLTARQLEILGLLAEGRTNAEIAARLVVSVRTVDHHVSAVLQKLGLAGRREAARAAAALLDDAGCSRPTN